MNLFRTLQYLRPNAAFGVIENDYAQIDWQSDETIPTLAECQAAWDAGIPLSAAEVEAADRRRRQAYQTEADPLFFKAQRGEIALQVWLDKVAEIKARF